MEKFKILDLFSGIGGFSLGLERTGGFETVAFCEVDKKATLVLNKHWPDVPVFDDVKTLSKDKLDEQGISIDVICGGFPCQDISLAGKGAGLAGERSGLWFEFHRLIKEIQPQIIIAENVSALRSRGLDQVLRSLSEIGYDAEWHCIPASAVGAPHQRDRIWIIAYPNANSINWRPQPQLTNNNSGKKIYDELGGLRSNVAYTESNGWQQRDEKFRRRTEGVGARQKLGLGDGSETLANTLRKGLERQRQIACGVGTEYEDVGDACWWATEPDVGRVAHGVSKRVDRLKQLGNAVVPQIPELIGYAILENMKNGTS